MNRNHIDSQTGGPDNLKLPRRIAVAMSGGVDSSVAAALLADQGHEVIGIMMRLWSEPTNGLQAKHNRCCTPDQMADARKVAGLLGIPFYVLDVQDFFYNSVVQPYLDSHSQGCTPNPCINCNRTVRFDYLLNHATALGVDFLATGHFARIREHYGTYELLQAKDKSKDQSYVLHVLGQEELTRVVFPIGEYTKDEVRSLASKFSLPVASKDESMDLCFLADGNYHRFLEKYAPDSEKPGQIKTNEGLIIGEHRGLAHYTIGQRKGLGIALGEPVFVLRKDIVHNVLVVGSKDKGGTTRLLIEQVNWISGKPADNAKPLQVKIRYRALPVSAIVKDIGKNRAIIEFDLPVFGATAGQGAVVYDRDVCLGGGIISLEELE
jgi:tRNA-specific 2-thiouridylase